jgi:hypothetical protein
MWEVIILQRTCGDSYQSNMATRLEQWSKQRGPNNNAVFQ